MTTDQINAAITAVIGIERDYTNCLNAMHEAEKVLTDKQGVRYRMALSFNSDGLRASFRTVEAAMTHATATQRAEAFLRTLGFWKESLL